MARLMQSPTRPRSASGASHQYGYDGGSGKGGLAQQQKQSLESLLANLTRLLARLQQNIIYPDPEHERRLRTSEYEREKARTVGLLDFTSWVRACLLVQIDLIRVAGTGLK